MEAPLPCRENWVEPKMQVLTLALETAHFFWSPSWWMSGLVTGAFTMLLINAIVPPWVPAIDLGSGHSDTSVTPVIWEKNVVDALNKFDISVCDGHFFFVLVGSCWFLLVVVVGSCWFLLVLVGSCWLVGCCCCFVVVVVVVVVLVVGCWLLVVCCWLLVVGCWLLVVGCWLLVVGCWLLVVGCWLLSLLSLLLFTPRIQVGTSEVACGESLRLGSWADPSGVRLHLKLGFFKVERFVPTDGTYWPTGLDLNIGDSRVGPLDEKGQIYQPSCFFGSKPMPPSLLHFVRDVFLPHRLVCWVETNPNSDGPGTLALLQRSLVVTWMIFLRCL